MGDMEFDTFCQKTNLLAPAKFCRCYLPTFDNCPIDIDEMISATDKTLRHDCA